MNIKDVAELAGVSVATVSRVLNNKQTVTQDTREKVEAAAKKLGYQPNLLGRHLRCKKTNIILVMVPSLSNQFCSKVVRGIEKAAQKDGYFVMVNAAGDSIYRQNICLDLVKRRFADGIILLSSTGLDDEIKEIAERYSVVQCSEYIPCAKAPFVSIDNYAAAYEETEYLIKCGRRDIVFLSARNRLSSTTLRLAGFADALRDNGIEFSNDMMLYGDYMFKSSVREITALIKSGKHFNAVLAISDTMAAGAIRALKQNGIRVPEEVAVTGFDNTELAYITEPGITTVSQPQQEMGMVAFEMLRALMNNEDAENRILKHKLIVRNSTEIIINERESE